MVKASFSQARNFDRWFCLNFDSSEKEVVVRTFSNKFQRQQKKTPTIVVSVFFSPLLKKKNFDKKIDRHAAWYRWGYW